MPAEKTFVTTERVFRDDTLVYGVGEKIPWSRAVALGLAGDDDAHPTVNTEVRSARRMRQVPNLIKRGENNIKETENRD